MIRFVAIDLWDCSLDPVERLLRGSRHDGAAFSCNLSKPEYRLLQRLLMAPGTPVSRDELTSHAWHGRPVTAGSLSNAVFNLRQAFGAEDGHKVIRTVPNQGYRIQAQVIEGLVEQPALSALAAPPLQEKRAAERAPIAAIKRHNLRGWVPALAAVTLANLVVALWFAHLQASPQAGETAHRLTYEYLADIGERRFFAQLADAPSSERFERALKAFANHPPQLGADKSYVYVNRGDADDEFSFFLCQDRLEAKAPDCSAYVILQDPHS
ncbi:winged helix-turn-helix domain-containing protein [Pseudomonas knackmussii]|uniref:winged helix-turn-helix domain-containing protein n=1 Tax=Pseudomonas knackmussii TaxID=65741 RepID=UPI0013626797|nr:winged helix-turn-helix domain-containing protein [Pseudomonas knackmussii]